MDRRRAAGALLALAACFATATAAPTSNHTALDLYDGPTEGCYYNFQHYGEGDRIMTNEPCLNCTCHNRMLMCYLRVCPFTKPIGQDCTVEKRADQCCPIVTCPDVPVDLLTSTSTTSPAEYGGTGVGRVDKYGCSINGKYFPEGAKVPSTPNKPCEHCYCIRNMTTCVMQECTLHVDGCTPIYHKDVCCPVRYFCDHPEGEPLQLDDMTTTTRPTPGFLLTTTTTEEPTTEIQTKRECIEDGQIYADGALIKTEKPCVHCYCMKGDIVCVVQECGTPMENEGKNCTSIPPREGQCCPDTYICEGDEITTGTPLEEIATTKYRSETDKTYTEPSLETEGSGDEVPLTTVPSDLSTPKVEQRLEDKGQSSPITTESFIFEETEQATTEPDKGLNTVPSDIIDKEHTKPTVIEQTTIKEDILSTAPFVSHDQEISTVSSVQEQDSEIPETTSSEEKMEKPTTVLSVQIEDETTQASIDKTTPKDKEEVTESEIESKLETAATTDSDQSRTTQSNIISELTTEPILPEQNTLKSETVTETKQTTPETDNLGSMGTSPKDVHTEATVADFTEHSSETSPKEKTTTVHDREVTESSKTSEESEISTPSPQEDITERISEVTKATLIEGEPTTHIAITPGESSEPPIFDENTTKHDVTELEQHQTTISSIEDGRVTMETTPKVVEDVKEPTEPMTPKEDKAPTTESLVKETDTTQQPSREQTLVPAIESEQKPTTEQILEQHTEEERVSTVTPSTEGVPQDEIQETTEVNVITTLQPAETTTLNPEDNEISEDILPPGRIPGEGDCLLNGVTYRNDSSVPNTNKCQSSCKCISSNIKCDPIICSPQPEYMENCQLVYDTPDSCCPTYICDETKETIPPQSHSQMSGTESPSPSPSLQCNGDECELSVEKQPTTVLPDLTKTPTSDSCGPDGCESQLPEQQPEKCVGDKCTECVDGNCQLPSSPETPPHIPSETIPQGCEGSEGCQETKTEIPLCEGESCVSETLPPAPEIPTPCEGDSCPVQPEGCTSDKCIPSDNIPPQTTQESEICTEESGCIQIQEKECEGDNCRRNEDKLEEDLPSKCTSPDCEQKEPISPGTPLATTEKTLLEVSTLLPESHTTLLGESSTEPHIITESIIESTTNIPPSTGDHKVTDVSFDTETSEGIITTQSPHVTEVFEGENTVPDEKITETETHYTEQPLMAATGVYAGKDRTTTAKETEIVHTESPAVTESQEALTLSPVESATQRDDTPTETPESTLNELDTEKETDKPQTPISEFESTQPEVYEPTTKASVSDQPEKSTEFGTHDEGTEIPVPSSTISSTQEISGLKTTPEYIEQSTTLPESPEKVGEQENITRSSEGAEQSTALPEMSIEQETTSLSFDSVTMPAEKLEHVPTMPSDIEKSQTTTQPQDVTSIVTEESITPSEVKTDLPSGLVTDALKPVDEKTVTDTTVSPVTILYDTESPLEPISEDKLSSEGPETMAKETESPAVEEQTEHIDTYPTTSRTIIAETTKKPEDEISPELPIEEMQTETPISEGSLAPDTKATAEPSETARPEIATETPVPRISESTEPIPTSQDQESTPEIVIATEGKTGLTDKPSETETEISIPVAITEEPSAGTKVTKDSQSCDNESECKKAQVPDTFVSPSTCEGDSCTVQEEDCKSGECAQGSMPPINSQPEICDEEKGCNKISEVSPECTEENCRKTDISDLDHGKIPISDTEKTTESPSILEEALQTKLPVGTHATETVVPVSDSAEQAATHSTPSLETEIPKTTLSYWPDKRINETVVEDAEKEVTEFPEYLITSAPIPSETQKYDVSDQTDTTQPSEVTPKPELTTKQPEILDTERPSSHDIIPEKEMTMAPEVQFPIDRQGEVTKTPVSVEITVPATEKPESTASADEHITEVPEHSKPEENKLMTKPETTDTQTISPEQHEPEAPQPEVTTEHSEVTSKLEQDHEVKEGESETEVPEIPYTIPDFSTKEPDEAPPPEVTTEHSEVTSKLEQDHEVKEGESETEVPEIPYTIPDFSTKEPELPISQESETPKVETGETTETPHITEKSTEPKQVFSETTPYLVELEEHTHKIEEEITTLLSSEEPITQEPVYIHDEDKEHDINMSTPKPSDLSTDTVAQYTEKPSVDNVSVETITPESHPTISEEIHEITTESSITEGILSETSKPTSLDTTQELFSKFGTESTDQEKEISTVAPTLPEEKQTTIISSETDTPHPPIDEIIPQTEQYTTYSPAIPFETTASEEFMPATSKTTTQQAEKDIATQSPSVFDNYTKPETSTDVYPSTHAAETQKPVFSDMPPTDEVPQPEDDSHFPPTGGYQPEPDYAEEDQAFGPGTCRYGGKVYVSAQQIPRDDPCDFCFCFRSDIICLQQSCPPPIHGCHEEPIQGFCCPRYECPVSMATTLNVTTTTTTTTTTLPPHFLPHAYKGAAQRKGCQIKGHIYKVGEVVRASSGPCLHCTCGGDGQMKCDPKVCTPEPMLRQMIAAAVSTKRRR